MALDPPCPASRPRERDLPAHEWWGAAVGAAAAVAFALVLLLVALLGHA